MVKYCPICEFRTTGNKLARHILNKHAELWRKPRKVSARKICDYITVESRRSFSVIPMSAIKETLGPYWEDRCFRSIAHKYVL